MDFGSVEAERAQIDDAPASPGGVSMQSNPYAVRRGRSSPVDLLGFSPCIDSPAREPEGGDSSIRPEELRNR